MMLAMTRMTPDPTADLADWLRRFGKEVPIECADAAINPIGEDGDQRRQGQDDSQNRRARHYLVSDAASQADLRHYGFCGNVSNRVSLRPADGSTCEMRSLYMVGVSMDGKHFLDTVPAVVSDPKWQSLEGHQSPDGSSDCLLQSTHGAWTDALAIGLLNRIGRCASCPLTQEFGHMGWNWWTRATRWTVRKDRKIKGFRLTR
jgi:hypothetical protein